MSDDYGFSFVQTQDDTLVIRLAGRWHLTAGIPSFADLQGKVAATGILKRVDFDTRDLTGWDSSMLAFVSKVNELCRQHNIPMDREGLPTGVRKLLELAEAVPERKGARREVEKASLLERIGTRTIGAADSLTEMLAFLGQMTITFVRLFGMKARYRASDLVLLIQQCGVQALPIVTLISFLVGVILAFVGAVQLKQFGAQIYVADLVGIALANGVKDHVLVSGRAWPESYRILRNSEVVGQDVILRAGWLPALYEPYPRPNGRVANPPQLTKLPHMRAS